MNFDFLGINVPQVHFDLALDVLSRIFGFGVGDRTDNWAFLHAANLKVELFGDGPYVPADRHQSVIPMIRTHDLNRTLDHLHRDPAVNTTLTAEHLTPLGRATYLRLPGGATWALLEEVDHAHDSTGAPPTVAALELRCAHPAQYLSFLTETLDFQVRVNSAGHVVVQQHPDRPRLLLEAAPERLTPVKYRTQAPFYLSFSTTDVDRDSRVLLRAGRPLVSPRTTHAWGGTDVILLDPNNDPIQVVQYPTT
ncbi:VOC family protein [Deinococcus hopiensis]|uniref:Glyoxalase/fosfomycin resistance/dioxygenase domain-containing protein n=1 Tax=Deinococcus hopiensis KR-140 TaxID=695939 RepID=A0A1W1UPG4_9DEIO|nr:VOC family protein [Deinococcus hopiensis]SMB83028.1 hypothetical protein SAMN00790413_04233 [Deinococcus hopiensis KR-140]